MIRYATAIRAGTASTEAILRRFTTANAMHPTYQAMVEVGRAQKTLFLARYLRDRTLQREINAGLNVVESWNRGNSVIFYGKGGDIATNAATNKNCPCSAYGSCKPRSSTSTPSCSKTSSPKPAGPTRSPPKTDEG